MASEMAAITQPHGVMASIETLWNTKISKLWKHLSYHDDVWSMYYENTLTILPSSIIISN